MSQDTPQESTRQDTPLLESVKLPPHRVQYSYFITHTLVGTATQTAADYGAFFISPLPTKVISISEMHGTLGTDGSDVTLQIERLQGTEASGSGDSLLATAFDLKGTIDTVVKKEVRDFVGGTTRRTLFLAANDRLGFVLAGTPTAVADVVVTVELLGT